MGRHETWVPPSYWREAPSWYRNFINEWSAVVGDRVRRIRSGHDMKLADLSKRIVKPNGGFYSPSFFSRLERGALSPPLYAYLGIATLFDIHPGRLLGADDAERDATPDEMVLVRFLRRRGIAPDAALHALADADLPPFQPEPLAPSEPLRQTDREFTPDPYAAPGRAEIVKPRFEIQERDWGLRPPGDARRRGRV